MPHDLTRFDLSAMLSCSRALRAACQGQASIEAAGRAACQWLYDELTGPDGERACALVRCYITQRYGALPDELQKFAMRILGTPAPPSLMMPCLSLLATVGDLPDWNDRRASRGHQAIPLPSPQAVERAPMIAQLLSELGLATTMTDENTLSLVRRKAGQNYGVFHVERALGSPYIPAQRDFVEAHHIESVVGFGSLLPEGDLFSVIVFSRVPIDSAAADRFRTLALDVKTGFVRSGGQGMWEPA